jgi:uncharacterized protein (TIGR02145 family)
LDFNQQQFEEPGMKKSKSIMKIACGLILMFSYVNLFGNSYESEQPGSSPDQTQTKTTQTTTKSTQTTTKSSKTSTKPAQTKSTTSQKSTKAEPDNKSKDAGTVKIGNQYWAVANLNVVTFRNGDTIPEARTFQEWVAAGDAGKPAWCFYNNDPANGPKYGRLYNWYAVNDPRNLAPAGWSLPSDGDWAQLIGSAGGQGIAGSKMKSTSGWTDGYNGLDDIGFKGLPAGYRVENGSFLNLGGIGIWWSTTENNSRTAIDHFLSQNANTSRSNSPKQRGESVRCIKK